ncbi:MAG TPA: DNA repair protein RecN [Nitrospiria bacterium]|nr:DNA repair protein RecN [Nitrospiria bacterium]
MLRELRIQNFAIIDRLEIRFHEQLNVLTGETGSGKSIVVDAVDLLLGGRASSEQIRTDCDEAVLEAAFDVSRDGPVAAQLVEMGLSGNADEDLIIRRVISRSGKSRAQVNGGLVTLGQLQQVGNLLVDIHGQHEHQSLLKPEQQLYLLDAFGQLLRLREDYHRRYLAFQAVRSELSELGAQEQERSRREDFLRFQAREIETAGLFAGEDAGLERERSVLANAERLAMLADQAYQDLYAADGAIMTQLARVESSVDELARTDERMKDVSAFCSEASAQLREVAGRLRDYKEGIEYDPKRLEQIEERLHLIVSLKKKYGPTIEGLLEFRRKAEEELAALSTHDERVKSLAGALEEGRAKCAEMAKRLTQERSLAARSLEKKVEKELAQLKMGRTKFKIRMGSRDGTEALGSTGAEGVEFLVTPNPGEEAKPLARIASGGELSRMMLSLKSILAAVDRVPTLIFDEVDAGIGGGVAEVVGQRLKALARHRQVLCITHLPQIASQAAVHFTVEKSLSNGRTVTKVKRLEKEDRVEEIARMLGGRELTPTAFKHAREMLNLAAQ